MFKKKLPSFEGAGHIRFSGHAGPVSYAVEGDPARLKPGPVRLRGVIHIEPDLARLAFRAGEGVLQLDGGAMLRLTMIGHSSGAAEVFVELRA